MKKANISKGANHQQNESRNKYTAAQKEKAQHLYMKSISVVEIAELLNINVATVKRWRALGKWKKVKEITVINKRDEAKKLRKAGFKKIEIAKKLEIGVTTVYRYLKENEKEV